MSTYEISKSSLLSLKAEILRKQEELSKAKADNEIKIKNLKKNAPLDLKNKGVDQRQAQDNEEDENLLKKSREALQAKSRLYERLSRTSLKLSARETEYYQRYLVRFDKKSKLPDLPPEDSDDDFDPEEDEVLQNNYEPPSNPDEEWVEYIDCLGRTRTCLRKDLEYLKEKDKDLKLIVESKERNKAKTRSKSRSPIRKPEPKPRPKTPENKVTEEQELLSSDMRREVLRKQWEEEEERLRDKSNIHYQDVLFNEARTHGVGYYSFSKDEEERAKQQEALKKLREETQEQQKKSQELRKMREKQLAARVLAAKNRKRQRMGLPPLEENEPELVQPEPTEEKEEDDTKQSEKELEKRKKHIRPWDIGKEGVKSHYEYTQEEWVRKKRKERPEEFAPSYDKHRERKRKRDRYDDEKHERKKTERGFRASPIRNELSDDEDSLLKDYNTVSDRSKKGAEIPPPSSYDHKPTRKVPGENMSESIEAGLKFLREQLEKKQGPSGDYL